jgi:DNA replication protein DnaC
MNLLDQVSETVLESMRKREKEYLERKAPGATEPTQEQIEFARAYWDRVFSEPVRRTELMVSRSTKQVMSYEEARKKFWAILQIRAAHIEKMEDMQFEWVFDESQSLIIRDMLKYFINDPSSKYPLTKGLFIYGAPGTGKTEIVTALSKFCDTYEQITKGFKMRSMSDIYTRARADKDHDPITTNVQNDACFDEFGRYVGPVIRFGDPLDINEVIIEQRYARAKRYGQFTHFIANATPNELEGSFTPMVFDRLRSMCTSIHFTGKSKRHGRN